MADPNGVSDLLMAVYTNSERLRDYGERFLRAIVEYRGAEAEK